MRWIIIVLVAIAITANARVYINAPDKVIVGNEFYIYINANISNFDSANYTITFPEWMEVIEVMNGKIGNTTIPVNGSITGNDSISIVQNVAGTEGVSGNGYLSVIRAKAMEEGIADIDIHGIMADANGSIINSTWDGDEIKVYKTVLKIDSKNEAVVNETVMINISLCNVTDVNAVNFEIEYTNIYIKNVSSAYNLSFIENNGTLKGVIIIGNESGNFTIARLLGVCGEEGMAEIGIKNATISDVNARRIDAYTMNATIAVFKGNPPVANFTWYPHYPCQNESIQFNSMSYDSDGFIVNCTWDFGDGSIGYGKNVSHAYSLPSIYNVTLIVTDDNGLSSSMVKHIVVWDRWDINMDGHVNILDLIIVGQHWGEEGAAGWLRADVNNDGMINVLDMIMVAQHWTG